MFYRACNITVDVKGPAGLHFDIKDVIVRWYCRAGHSIYISLYNNYNICWWLCVVNPHTVQGPQQGRNLTLWWALTLSHNGWNITLGWALTLQQDRNITLRWTLTIQGIQQGRNVTLGMESPRTIQGPQQSRIITLEGAIIR